MLRRKPEIEECFRQLRHLQLSVLLFNQLNSYIIFTFKIFCIYVAVVTGFGAIVSSGSNPIYGAFCALVFVDMTAVYGFVYEKAFAIPNGIREVKSLIKVRVYASRKRLWMGKLEMVTKLRAIPAFGIHLGDFHTMERTSTPIFVDFVIRNLAGLLVLLR